MSTDNEQTRSIVAIVLSALILFSWQYFFAPSPLKTIPSTEQRGSASMNVSSLDGGAGQENRSMTSSEGQLGPSARAASGEGSLVKDFSASFVVGQGNVSGGGDAEKRAHLLFRNNGEVGNINVLAPRSLSKKTFLETIGHDWPVRFLVGEGPLFFDTVTDTEDGGRLLSSSQNGNSLRFSFPSSSSGTIRFRLSLSQAQTVGFRLESVKKSNEHHMSREFLVAGQEVQRIKVGDVFTKGEANARWLAIDFDYHDLFVIFDEKLPGHYATAAQNSQQLEFFSNAPVRELEGDLLYTAKEYDYLSSFGKGLELSVDYGFFSLLAVPILKLLKFFYSLWPNYGMAIILLTFFIRLITFPIQYKSFVGMKKMQTMKPEMDRIRELYANDPERLQKETMLLFKKVGANPLSGCLPLLLQAPIFLAMYKVLYNSVELVGAPWGFWIQDLSLKDPYYVLPVFMTGLMFLNYKITPTTTTDPVQQKVFAFMPLVFGFITKDFPAGLTLYSLVSTLFGMLQQIFVFKKTS